MSSITATKSFSSSLAVEGNSEGTSVQAAQEKKNALQKRREEAENVAQEFETMFVDMMVKSMRQTAQREDVSNAEDIYQGMLDSEHSKAMTASQSFGIRTKIIEWLEQTDPELKTFSANRPIANEENEHRSGVSLDTKSLLNESMALKAASQAYRLASPER